MKKVVWISSYLPRAGGIAYYSADYIFALKEHARKCVEKVKFKIISHTDASQADYPIIDLNDKKWHVKVLEAIKKEKPDIVHIQHEYGLYETYKDCNKRVVELIKMIREEDIPVIMTYHTVYRKIEGCHADFVSESLKYLSAGILHEDYQKQALPKNIGWIPKNVYILPHGSEEGLRLNRENIREVFGYGEDELVVGSAGLSSERKGFLTLIKQWPKVVEKFPNATLALELKPHFNRHTRIYIDKVLEEIMASSVSDNIEFSVKNYNDIEFYRRMKSFDVLVLPYRSESQSGVLAHGFASGVPAIVTDIEGLGAEIRNSNGGIAVKKREDFYKAIIKMLGSKSLREKYSKNVLKYVKEISGWSIIARETFGIYRKFW
tara:strand:- start:1499 stop:2629 length:1131 start_codon:yes stop_codon:yes gene_type:complete